MLLVERHLEGLKAFHDNGSIQTAVVIALCTRVIIATCKAPSSRLIEQGNIPFPLTMLGVLLATHNIGSFHCHQMACWRWKPLKPLPQSMLQSELLAMLLVLPIATKGTIGDGNPL